VLPYLCENNSDCNIIDVVEQNNEMIGFVNSLGLLTGTTIINDNIFTYTPNKNYDVILLDIWMCDCDENLTSDVSTLVTKYLPYLNSGGFIFIPINKKLGDTIFTN